MSYREGTPNPIIARHILACAQRLGLSTDCYARVLQVAKRPSKTREPARRWVFPDNKEAELHRHLIAKEAVRTRTIFGNFPTYGEIAVAFGIDGSIIKRAAEDTPGTASSP